MASDPSLSIDPTGEVTIARDRFDSLAWNGGRRTQWERPADSGRMTVDPEDGTEVFGDRRGAPLVWVSGVGVGVGVGVGLGGTNRHDQAQCETPAAV
jgi:hypothetical protein